jgi:hypothetical protein
MTPEQYRALADRIAAALQAAEIEQLGAQAEKAVLDFLDRPDVREAVMRNSPCCDDPTCPELAAFADGILAALRALAKGGAT